MIKKTHRCALFDSRKCRLPGGMFLNGGFSTDVSASRIKLTFCVC